jgi:hypothetical protein
MGVLDCPDGCPGLPGLPCRVLDRPLSMVFVDSSTVLSASDRLSGYKLGAR